MRLNRLLLPVVAALLVSVVFVLPSAAPARTTTAPLPGALQALLRRGAALPIRAIVARVTTSELDGEGWDTTIDTEQLRASPLEFAYTYGEGPGAGHLRYVDGFAYLEVPGLYRLSGGRRWVRATAAQIGVSVAQLAEARSVRNLNPATEVDALLKYATSVTTVGRTVIARDPTTEFLAQLSASAVPGGGDDAAEGIDLQLYVDPSGLVKYVRLDIGGVVTESSEVLTAVYPVSVHRPRPGDTITFARLEQLQAALDRDESSAASGSGSSGVYIDPSAWLARPLVPSLRLPGTF